MRWELPDLGSGVYDTPLLGENVKGFLPHLRGGGSRATRHQLCRKLLRVPRPGSWGRGGGSDSSAWSEPLRTLPSSYLFSRPPLPLCCCMLLEWFPPRLANSCFQFLSNPQPISSERFWPKWGQRWCLSSS